ncbi:MAG: hypothetical protein ACTSU2_14170 [Promethearchaeota archaeon]
MVDQNGLKEVENMSEDNKTVPKYEVKEEKGKIKEEKEERKKEKEEIIDDEDPDDEDPDDEYFEAVWRNWASRRRCEASHKNDKLSHLFKQDPN